MDVLSVLLIYLRVMFYVTLKLDNLLVYLQLSNGGRCKQALFFSLLQTLALHLEGALTNDNFGIFFTSLSNDRGKRLLVKRKSAFDFVKVEIQQTRAKTSCLLTFCQWLWSVFHAVLVNVSYCFSDPLMAIQNSGIMNQFASTDIILFMIQQVQRARAISETKYVHHKVCLS